MLIDSVSDVVDNIANTTVILVGDSVTKRPIAVE
jgi:hypothetical protein